MNAITETIGGEKKDFFCFLFSSFIYLLIISNQGHLRLSDRRIWLLSIVVNIIGFGFLIDFDISNTVLFWYWFPYSRFWHMFWSRVCCRFCYRFFLICFGIGFNFGRSLALIVTRKRRLNSWGLFTNKMSFPYQKQKISFLLLFALKT